MSWKNNEIIYCDWCTNNMKQVSQGKTKTVDDKNLISAVKKKLKTTDGDIYQQLPQSSGDVTIHNLETFRAEI